MSDTESSKKTVLWERGDMPWGQDKAAPVPDTQLVPPPAGSAAPAVRSNKTVLWGAVGEADDPMSNPVAGWLVIIKGPGRGAFVKVGQQVNTIGRDPDNSIVLDFNDNTISGKEHAEIIYDPANRKFYASRKGGKNLAYVNGAPVLQVVELNKGDLLRLGNTEMRFVPFCGDDFDWGSTEQPSA
jgi:hypothetical protein